MTKATILLIDDEPDLRESIADFLEGEGYTVAQAQNGQVALDFLNQGNHPCVILLDYMMPVMDGKKFCQIFNEGPSINSIPIILLTAAKITD